MNVMKFDMGARVSALRRTALAVAIVAGTGVTGQALAQATTGTIFGSAPASGATVQVTGGSGFNRTVPVDGTGHYSITVPVGDYTVSLIQNGAVAQSHDHVNPTAGGASEADFVQRGDTKSLSTVTVTANALPPIDVTSTTQNTTITAKQLTELPVARNSAAIALLAPGTIAGSEYWSGPTGEPVISVNGSSIVENAYYINGFNTSDPLSNTGGITLPYGSIDQQQTLTSGYGAMYGRSAGGVISQIGKSGSNDWHFGGQALWEPAFLQGSKDNLYYANPNNIYPYQMPGQIYGYYRRNSSWNTVYDAYVSGPLIKDKLFMFVSYEANKSQGHSVGALSYPGTPSTVNYWKDSDPKFYAKLDWNIDSSNILSFTGVRNQTSNDPSQTYVYDYGTHTNGAFLNQGWRYKTTFDIGILKYTSYITDNLTLNAMFGKMTGEYYYQIPAASPEAAYGMTLPSIYDINNENPAYLPPDGTPYQNLYGTGSLSNPKHSSEVRNLRIDLDWKLGNHDLLFGIDNDDDADKKDGSITGGPGYTWDYQAYQPGADALDANGYTVGPGTPCTIADVARSCFVVKGAYSQDSTVTVKQRAQYIQDNWQVTPNLLLNLGLRNDQFTNYNPTGAAFLRLTKPQWAPRLGVSWDVFGDSTMKVYGNAGRYYLAMPSSVALTMGSAPLSTSQYYIYNGIGPTGIPLWNGSPTTQQVAPNTLPGGIYYVNGWNGQMANPKTADAQSLKAEYVDQFVLGMQQQFHMLDQSWVYGVSGTVNRMGRAIDDWDSGQNAQDMPILQQAAAAQGVTASSNPNDYVGTVLINPGVANTITVPNGSGGYSQVKIPWADFQMPQLKRRYYALDMYLEHPFDGKWWGKIDYTFARSYGNYEGPTSTTTFRGGQSQSGTAAWDFPQIMQYANGEQANSQRHHLRIFGSYQITREWSAGGTYDIASGTPLTCLGYYGPLSGYGTPADDPGGYGSSYHWCNGVPSPPGANGNTPWTHQLNLQMDYRPAFADHKLDFQLQVHNVFNEQKSVQNQSAINWGPGVPNPWYLMPYRLESPRWVQLGVTYDY